MTSALRTSLALALALPAFAAEKEPDPAKPVSYWRHVRPIFQAQCHGCHQPAKAKGNYVMTDFAKLLTPGEDGAQPLIAGKPEESLLFQQITPDAKGEADMPKGKPALAAKELALVKRWIAEGAKDDTPANTKQRYDMEHPPVYTRPPVVTSLDYSPDSQLIAAAGFHEVLVHKADGSGLVARLVGLSERIETVRFSPDGKKLAVAGGQPGRMGELQIWDVEQRKLAVSVPVGFDTAYGASWSPDGKRVAVGLPDNTVRAYEADSGKEILKVAAHNDWVLDTVWAPKGEHIISVGRDMSAKLNEVATQRFVDNVTSITPGALRGGIHSVARHPEREEILIGAADGTPQIYRIFRQTPRKIGDNACLIRKFPAMEGRIFTVDYAPDGKRIAAVATLDGKSTVNIYAAEFDPTLPEPLKAILSKDSSGKIPEFEAYTTKDVKLLASAPVAGATYALSWRPDGTAIAIAGDDGKVRLINPADGKQSGEFSVAPAAK